MNEQHATCKDRDMSPAEYRTFVVRITDAAAAQSTIKPLMAAFSGQASLPGIEVTGVSMVDEMTRADLLEMQDLDSLAANADRRNLRWTPSTEAALATPGLAEALLLADHASPMPAQAQAAMQTLRRAFASCLNCSPEDLLAAAAAHHLRNQGAGDDGRPQPLEDEAQSMAP